MAKRELDFIIFGATGYTGKYCIEWMHNCLKNESKKFSWGIAGRNRDSLAKARADVENLIGSNLNDVQIVVADVKNDESLMNMTRKCRMLINCVGPYALYGEPVVKACIQTGTHQVDLAGEPQYLEKSQLDFHKAAEAAKVYIVQSCGFDSIPTDVGINFLQEKFQPGQLNSVDAYANMKSGPSGNKINHGTWDSAVNAVGHMSDTRPIRKRLFTTLFTKRWPEFKYKVSRRLIPFRDPVKNNWTIPFWETDMEVNKRSQMFALEMNGEEPHQLTSYLMVPGLLHIAGMALVGLLILLFGFFKCGRRLLHNYPAVFTFGLVSKDGPTRRQVLESSFEMYLVGQGWPGKKDESSPSSRIVGRVKGPNAAYAGTSIIMIQAAMTVLEEMDKLPSSGGVLTPGYAFRRTNIVDRLSRNDVEFEILSRS